MHNEIERKFLVANDDWRLQTIECRNLRDGLVSYGANGKVRVRIEGDRAWLTIKGPRSGITRAEFDFEIPLLDAELLLEKVCIGSAVEKERHLVVHAGTTWEIDVFKGKLDGVIWAEVELDSEGQHIDRPEWLGREVTGDPQFRHAKLLELCEQGKSPAAIAESLLET